jgi:hypothetical protein
MSSKNSNAHTVEEVVGLFSSSFESVSFISEAVKTNSISETVSKLSNDLTIVNKDLNEQVS